jgi:hypothetical protein
MQLGSGISTPQGAGRRPKLKRSNGALDGDALVVENMVGSGIFTLPERGDRRRVRRLISACSGVT